METTEKIKKNKGGRPPWVPDDLKTMPVTFTVPKDILKRFRAIARERGINQSGFITNQIRDWLRINS